ncbi:MAG TPA: hypothetical protein VFS12_15370 [Terriglobia bacterium]|nr:hypothetical protein [Terriglobia bacterium]
MLSLIGIPPFSGFMGKLCVFGSLIDKGLYWFAAIGALKAMLIGGGSGTTAPLQVSFLSQALLVALLVPNVLLIVFWNPIDRWTAAPLNCSAESKPDPKYQKLYLSLSTRARSRLKGTQVHAASFK